jgi:hypothetical protein
LIHARFDSLFSFQSHSVVGVDGQSDLPLVESFSELALLLQSSRFFTPRRN